MTGPGAEARETARAVTGRCLCGRVRWETDGSRNWACYCHCDSCRRNCAAPVAAFFGVPGGHWRWTGATPARFASTDGVTRHFCATCGTPMAYTAEKFAGEIRFYAASLEDPAEFRPEFRVHYVEHLHWMQIADHLPRYARGGNEGDPE